MRSRDERGAIAIVTAAVMVIVLGVAAFVIDLGMQRVARQDLQALADVVALDLARMLDGRTATQIESGGPGPSLEQAKDASQARNDDDTVGDDEALDVVPTLLVPGEDGAGWRTADDNDVPEAVQVETSTKVDFGFAGAIGFSSGGAARSSIASARSSACFHVGSFAAAIERDASLEGPLDDVLDVDLTPLEYRALAGADLSLDDLAEQPPISSPSELLDGPLTLDELIAAIRAVLQAPPGTNGPALAALGSFEDDTDGALLVELREVLVVSDDDLDALRTDLNVLDILAPALLSAADGRLLDAGDIAGTGLDAPPTGAIDVRPGVQRVCGVGDATEGASVDASVDGGFEFVRRGVTVSANLSVDVALGGAEFALAGPAECREEEDESDRYDVAFSGGLSTQTLTAEVTLDGFVSPPQPRDVVSIEFDELTVDPALGLDVPLGTPDVESPAGLEVPGNAVNDQPRGRPVTTGVTLAQFARLPRISQAFLLDNVEIVYADDLDPTEAEAARMRAERRVNFLRLLINLALRDRTETATDAITDTVGSYADVLGATRAGADLYSEVRPTCVGVRLVG